MMAQLIDRKHLKQEMKELLRSAQVSPRGMTCLYLALVLMTIDITALADVAGQMGIILLLQAALMALFAIFVSYNMFGRNYGAAVMAAGNCGWGCGSGPNAVANEKAVVDQYGWHNVAWVLYPSFAVIIDDIYNPIFLSVFGGLLAH